MKFERFNIVAASVLTSSLAFASAETFYVAKNGSATNSGSIDSPLLTINAAAQLAQPGDTVIVGEGVYREWVDPPRGGASEDSRITYKAKEGDLVIILGSMEMTGWIPDGDVWKLELPSETFGELNPYAEGIRHPSYVEEDESGDGWGWLKYGRWAHRGDVIINGMGLVEQETSDGLAEPMSWYTETSDEQTTIWINVADLNPNTDNVELSRLPFGIFPSRAGLDYITVFGFVVANVATHWAPPTEFQPAAIGPNGGNHWIIENNVVVHSRGVGISIGIPSGDADLEEAGHHIIRNNVLLRNGQAGIAGQSWNHHTVIEGNWVEDTNYREEFGGWETAGIKLHNADDVLVADNVVVNVSTIDAEIGAAHGVWIDYENTNTRVTRNLISGAEGMSVLMEANWNGPNTVDHNLVFGGGLGTYSSRGDAWIHNLFVDTVPTWEDQDWDNRIPVSNSQWVQNIFVGKGLDDLPSHSPDMLVSGNVFGSGAAAFPETENPALANSLDAQLARVDSCTFEVSLEGASDLAASRMPDLSFLPVDLSRDFNGTNREGGGVVAGPFASFAEGPAIVRVSAPPSYSLAQRYLSTLSAGSGLTQACGN